MLKRKRKVPEDSLYLCLFSFVYALPVYLHPKELLGRNRDKEKDGFLLSSSPVACRTCCRVLLHPFGTSLSSCSIYHPLRSPFLLISSAGRGLGALTRTLTSHRERIDRNWV